MAGLFSRLRDGTAFQIKFRDRRGAGEALATALKFTLKKSNGKRPLVLAIPRGGVIVAESVAKRLGADFDIVIPRKLMAPDNKENAIGAVMPDGSVYLDDFLIASLKVPQDYIDEEKRLQLQEIERRTRLFRPDAGDYDIRHRTVVLVDDGIATGATVIVVARWLKKQDPLRLIIAAPVANPQVVDILSNEADSVEIISTPSNFASVNQFYQDFEQSTDQKVIEIMKRMKNAAEGQ